MRIRAVGEQLTFYDEEGNVIGHDPPLYPEDPDEEVRVINIVDYEDRLMGLDPNRKPDFFIDVEEQQKRADDFAKKIPLKTEKPVPIDLRIFVLIVIAVGIVTTFLGYILGEEILENYI